MRVFSFCSRIIVALALLTAFQFSSNLRAQWKRTNGPFGANIESFAVDGVKLLAGGSPGAFITTDGGALWTPINNGLGGVGSYGHLRDMLKKGSNIYVGGNGVFKTSDDGQTWTRVLEDTLESGTYGLATNGTILYAAGETNYPIAPRKWRIFKTTDDGTNWTECDTGIPDFPNDYFKPQGIAARGSTVLLATSDGIYRSADEGTTWALATAINFGMGTTRSFLVTADTLYAGMGGGNFIVTSTDDGVTWTSPQHNIEAAPNGGDLKVYAMRFQGSYMFAGTNEGIYRSPIGADSWTLSKNEGYSHGVGLDTRTFATIGPAIFAGGTAGIAISTDEGDSWQEVDSNLAFTTANGLFVLNGRVLSASENGISYSDDLGASWTAAIPILPFPGHFLSNGPDLYNAGATGIHRSTDNGKTWVVTAYQIGCSSLAMTDANHMFTGEGSGVARTTDNWQTWEYKNDGLDLTNGYITDFISVGSVLFVGTAGHGVFRSDDNADNWTQMNAGFESVPGYPNVSIVKFAASADGLGGIRLFAGMGSGGVYTSTDSGAHWNAANGPGPQPFQDAVYSFAVVDTSTLFAGDGRGGVFLSLDNGTSWTQVDSGGGFTGFLVNDMAILGDYLFAGPATNGVWFRRLSEMLPASYSSISGVAYQDVQMLGYRHSSSPPVIGQKIYARNYSGNIVAIAVTDSNGSYKLHLTSPGTYTVSQEFNRQLFPNYPSTFGTYTVSIGANDSAVAKDFGNLVTYRAKWLETNWSSPSTWEGGVVPGPTHSVSIPANSSIVIDALPNDSIRALRIESGGRLTASSNATSLAVEQGVIIEKNATLTLPSAPGVTPGSFLRAGDESHPTDRSSPGQPQLKVHSNWINRGTFSAGTSKVSLLDDGGIISGHSEFHDLDIGATHVYLTDNVRVGNSLFLRGHLIPDPDDTVFVDNASTSAISDTGVITRGTITRRLNPGETAPYRFESPATTVQFHANGTTPSVVSVTTYPDTDAYSLTHFDWKVVGGSPNTSIHAVAVDSVRTFSKWTVGVPRPHASSGPPGVTRMYTIDQQGGSNFLSQIQLHYEPSELKPATDEASMKVMRNPVVPSATLFGWNMVSLPLITELDHVADIYANTSSQAFTYNGGYQSSSNLAFGTGYWLKFSVPQTIEINGEDREHDTIPVAAGWNMIGGISVPMPATTVISDPPGLAASYFYGYSGNYQVSDTLFPGKGYWINSSHEGRLIFTVPTNGEELPRLSASPSFALQQLGRLSLTDSTGHEGKLYFGDNSSTSPKFFALPPLPPSGGFDVRYADQQMLESPGKKESREIPIQLTGAVYPVTIHWDPASKHKVPASLRIDSAIIHLDSRSSVVVSSARTSIALRLAAGERTELPDEFALRQNFPNPFNPVTEIRYELPQQSHVELKIYNMLGQVVKTLVDDVEEAGYKSLQWDASGIASGVYFCRIEAAGIERTKGKFTAVLKLVLVR